MDENKARYLELSEKILDTRIELIGIIQILSDRDVAFKATNADLITKMDLLQKELNSAFQELTNIELKAAGINPEGKVELVTETKKEEK